MKKLASAVPATLFLAWFYFLGFLYVEAYFSEFELQGRIATATVDSLLMTGSTALSVGAKPWYQQLPLLFEFVLLAGMYWLAARLVPAHRKKVARGEARGHAAPLLLALVALGGLSAWLTTHEGKLAARQVRHRFVDEGRGLRELYFGNGGHVMLGPALGCDDKLCAYLARDNAFVIARPLVVAEIPRPQPD